LQRKKTAMTSRKEGLPSRAISRGQPLAEKFRRGAAIQIALDAVNMVVSIGEKWPRLVSVT
jgi:hypothetical protein